MSSSFEHSARRGQVVVMAGAGVSAGKPSALPGWKPLNAFIVHALSQRIESSIDRIGWLSQFGPLINAQRDVERFPPDYQAQLIEEMCGERYFRALQALDVDVINEGHDGIAALAAAGSLKAVVTTNFDRLIERALDKHGVRHVVAYDDAGYVEMAKHLSAGDGRMLPIIKIHGCVSDHRSMIDTLKQRKRGRSRHLQACLEKLQYGYWLYLGFSAADIEADPSYLGLVAGAAKSAGATYVAYPGNPGLGKGARMLMDAHGGRGHEFMAQVPAHLAAACEALGVPAPTPIADAIALGTTQFEQKLQAWADALSPAAAGLCLAAILEAIGQAEPGVRILDRLVRKELYDQRDTEDFRALQLHYGRLGAAWGRFVAVPDLGGAASNASVESAQSLMRLHGSELGFAADSWLACAWLWLNEGQQATAMAGGLLKGFVDGQWGAPMPRSDEEAVDGWLSGSQVCILNANEQTILAVNGTANAALERAKRSGDVVRTARVAALKSLALAETTDDVPGILADHDADFADAERVGDGFALGMRAVALGRWHVGAGGLEVARTAGTETVAARALAHLQEAVQYFGNQGMDPWTLFALVQQTKAYADLRQFEKAQECIDAVRGGLQRFPVLASHALEAVAQVRTMCGDENAVKSFRSAVQAAEDSGLLARRDRLLQYVRLSAGASPTS